MSNITRMHAWSHLVMFLALFMITLAVIRFSSPTGLAAGNQSITAQNVGDLKPFLTAVGLMMGMLVAIIIALNANVGNQPVEIAPATRKAALPAPQKELTSLDEINHHLMEIRRKLRR